MRETAHRRAVHICLHAAVDLDADVRARRTATALARGGFRVTAIDVTHGQAVPSPVTGVAVCHVRLPVWVKRHRDPGSPVLWVASKVVRMVAGTVAVARVRADVYHACDIAALPAAWLAAKLHRGALVLESYELPMVQAHVRRRPLVRLVAGLAIRLLIPAADAVIVVSEPIAAEVKRRYAIRSVHVVRNTPEYFPRVRSNLLRRHLALPRGTRIALYQGGFQENRGLELLVRAAQHLPSNVVIALMGAGEAEERLRALARDLKVADRLRLLPPVPYRDLLRWTASADAGLLLLPPDHSLSIRWCLPNKLFEYLMAGLPVIASRLDAVAGIINKYEVGVVADSLEPHAVAHVIQSLMDASQRRMEMRERALKAVSTELRWEVEQMRLLAVYDALARGRSSAVSKSAGRQRSAVSK